MGNIDNSYAISVKGKFNFIRNFISFAMVAFGILSLIYFVFWIGATSDEIFFEYGKKIFGPMAGFLNGADTSVAAYLKTSLILFGSIVPMLIIQYLFDKIEEALINTYNYAQEKKQDKEKQEEYKNYMSRFDSIKMYSICLSIDYEGDKITSVQAKKALNQGIYLKIAEILKTIEPSGNVTHDDVLIFRAQNFSKYDRVYDSILNSLSKIKNVLEKKYGCKIIPSITTDAYSGILTQSSIKRRHFEIQSFNFKNRSLSTATFANKYKHLKHEKYVGVPIGEYAYFGNEKMGTYELNVIHKNLSKLLTI